MKILGSMIYTDEIQSSIEILEKGQIQTKPLVSGIISLEQLNENLENFNSPQRMKTLVVINKD